jgi:uncharacterized Ntn-hydrolase superfamily protein
VIATFSIVAFDSKTAELGVAVQSKFLSVGAVVPWLECGVGALATQAWANTTYGPRGLEMLRDGASSAQTIARLTANDAQREDRQIGIVDAAGNAACFTGERCIEWAGGYAGDGFATQGNCLAGPGVVSELARAYRETGGSLADRLLASLMAAQRAGGDKRGQQSAALAIVKPGGGYGGFNDRYVDLRVDDHPRPIDELARLLELHKLYFFAPEPADVLPIDESLGRVLVAELRRVGKLPATGSESFDEVARAALVAFMHVENLENRVRDDKAIDRQTLEYLLGFAR